MGEYWETDAAESLAKQTHEPEREAKWTGLHAASGAKIYRRSESRPIGFRADVRDEERSTWLVRRD